MKFSFRSGLLTHSEKIVKNYLRVESLILFSDQICSKSVLKIMILPYEKEISVLKV